MWIPPSTSSYYIKESGLLQYLCSKEACFPICCKEKIGSTENHSSGLEYKTPKCLKRNLQEYQRGKAQGLCRQGQAWVCPFQLPFHPNLQEGAVPQPGLLSWATSLQPWSFHNFKGCKQPADRWGLSRAEAGVLGFLFPSRSIKFSSCPSHKWCAQGSSAWACTRQAHIQGWHQGNPLKNSNIDPMGHGPGKYH